MTEHHNVSVALTDHGTRGRIYIDGTELDGVRGLDLKARAGNVATLTVDLIVYEAEVDGKVRVVVPEMTHQALVKLGWTAPNQQSVGGAER